MPSGSSTAWPPGRRASPWSTAGTLVLLDASVGRSDAGHHPPSLAGSRWAVELRHHRNGTLPPIDLAGHGRLVEFVAGLVAEGVAGGDGLVVRASTTSPAAGWAWPWPSWPCAPGSACRSPGWPTTTSCSPRPRPGSSCAPPTPTSCCRGRPTPAWASGCSAPPGGDRIVIDDLVDVDLAEATDAWRARLPDLLDDLAPVTN